MTSHRTVAFAADKILDKEARQVEASRLLAALSARPVPVCDVRISWLVIDGKSYLVATYMEKQDDRSAAT